MPPPSPLQTLTWHTHARLSAYPLPLVILRLSPIPEIENSLTGQLSTLIQKNGFLCQKIENLQRINTDLEYKFSITTSELERARREYTELQAKYELRNANYKELKDACYQLDAQLNKKNGTNPEDSIMSRLELASADRKKRRLSVDLTEGDSDTGFSPYDETEAPAGSMVAPSIRTSTAPMFPRQTSPPNTTVTTQNTWTCLWKNCNQVFNALEWLVNHVEEQHIGLGKVIDTRLKFACLRLLCYDPHD